MSMTIQCLRCYKNIPVTQDMVGLTILCPSCMERVYVTDGSSAKEGTIRSASSPVATPSQVMSQLPTSMQSGSSSGAFPIALVAALGGGAALVLIVVVALVMGRSKTAPPAR